MDDRLRVRLIGAITFATVILFSSLVFWIDHKKSESRDQVYVRARLVMDRAIHRRPGGCGQPLIDAKKEMDEQLAHAKARDLFINDRAMVYGRVLDVLREACENNVEPIDEKAILTCESDENCFDLAVRAFAAGQFDTAWRIALLNIGKQNGRWFVELRELTAGMKTINQ